MARTFISVTQVEIDIMVAENLRSRELELISYDFEKSNHEAAIAALGDLKWDDTTEKYKGLSRDSAITRAMADGLDSTAVQAVIDLNSLESHKLNLEAVKAETAKSERHYDNLLAALPEGDSRVAALDVIALRVKGVENAKITPVNAAVDAIK